MKTPDPQLRQELLDTKHKKYVDAFNQNDAAALAALFTEKKVLLPPETGPVYGREAIEKYFADLFTQYHASNFIAMLDEYSPHIIDTGDTGLWSSGDWSSTFKPKTGDSIQLKGKWGQSMSVKATLGRSRWTFGTSPQNPLLLRKPNRSDG
jgi:ketosteroid isomerase-like protein